MRRTNGQCGSLGNGDHLAVWRAVRILLLVVVALFLVSWFEEDSLRYRPLAGRGNPASLTIFAVGDTGQEDPALDGQAAVAGGLAWLDALRPADGLILLGDNFYPHGLERIHLADRLLRNLIEPYCGFVAAGGLRWAELATRCAGAPGPERPIWAVLGNHDHQGLESADLQRETVPAFVKNWTMPRETVASIALPGGVQLVLVDSVELIKNADFDLLTRVVEDTPGPWRVLVSHEPFLPRKIDHPDRLGMERSIRALAEARVPVQLAISGHEHNLQFIASPEPGPSLHVIAGTGSSSRPVRTSHEGRVFAREAWGFVRVQLFQEPQERLVVTLFEAPRWRLPGSTPARAVSSYALDREGRISTQP